MTPEVTLSPPNAAMQPVASPQPERNEMQPKGFSFTAALDGG